MRCDVVEIGALVLLSAMASSARVTSRNATATSVAILRTPWGPVLGVDSGRKPVILVDDRLTQAPSACAADDVPDRVPMPASGRIVVRVARVSKNRADWRPAPAGYGTTPRLTLLWPGQAGAEVIRNPQPSESAP